MYRSKIDSRFLPEDFGRLLQGDIFRNLEVPDSKEQADQIEVATLQLPYAVLLSQDCDVEQDFKNRLENPVVKHDKFVDQLLVAPAYRIDEFRQGTHLAALQRVMEKWNSEKFSQIKIQGNPRFHYLEGNQNYQIPDLIIDFKHYRTVERDWLYRRRAATRLATLNELFREDLSVRFAGYLSRIGLPEL